MAEIPDAYEAPPDILTDEILERHLGPGSVPASRPAPEAAAELDDEETDAEGTSDEDTDAGTSEEDDEALAGDEDPDDDAEGDDEGEEEKPAESEEDPNAEEVLSNATAEDLKRIQKDPALRKIHRSMMRDYTAKTMAVAEREKALEQFETDMGTPDGVRSYLTRLFKSQPSVAGDAFEAVATSDTGLDFLVEVGLHDPDMLEKANERVQDLRSDESAMRAHVRERDQIMRDRKIAAREESLRHRTFNDSYAKVQTTAQAEAARLGIEKDDLTQITDAIKAKLRGNVREDGSITLTTADIRSVVREAKGKIDQVYDRVAKRLGTKKVAESQQATKARAQNGARPVRQVPKSPQRRQPGKGGKWKPPAAGSGRDGLDAFFDEVVPQRFGGE